MNSRSIRILALLPTLLLSFGAEAQWHPPREGLKRIYFNLYTDSIKTVLAYYVNVEGQYRNGDILPMDSTVVGISADAGTMAGLEWRSPASIHFDKVTFHAWVKGDPGIQDTVTVWLKRGKDPRDAPGYEDRMDLPTVPEEVQRKSRRR